MSGWLTRIDERSESLERLSESSQPWWFVLDQRRASQACATWLNQRGRKELMTLFAGTELDPLITASPWLVEVEPGTPAAQEAQAFCQQRLGWIATAKPDATLKSIAEHLSSLFVLPDAHGGQTLVNLQQSNAWTAILASADAATFQHLMTPFTALYTPTPQGTWRRWVAPADEFEAPPQIRLDRSMEEALKESQQAWWLSSATATFMAEIPDGWFIRLDMLIKAGITRTEHFQRLLPLIQRSEALPERAQAILAMDTPARKKTKELESLI